MIDGDQMTASETLKADIEDFAARAHLENPLLTRAREGAIGPATVAAYLGSIRYLVEHTPKLLHVAGDRARTRGDVDLARYFRRKIGEEHGHDQWAANDLASLNARFGVGAPDRPAATMRELVRYVAGIIDEDPTLYLAYILFAEYFTVLVGSQWIRALEERCGIPADALSVVANHVDLDREHVAEGLGEIDALVDESVQLHSLRRALRGSMNRFDAFCHDVASIDPRIDVGTA